MINALLSSGILESLHNLFEALGCPPVEVLMNLHWALKLILCKKSGFFRSFRSFLYVYNEHLSVTAAAVEWVKYWEYLYKIPEDGFVAPSILKTLEVWGNTSDEKSRKLFMVVNGAYDKILDLWLEWVYFSVSTPMYSVSVMQKGTWIYHTSLRELQVWLLSLTNNPWLCLIHEKK